VELFWWASAARSHSHLLLLTDGFCLPPFARLMTNFFLTAHNCCNLSAVCVFTFAAIHSNVKYRKRAFQCLGNMLSNQRNFLETTW
jgi:hypothetical protein